MTLDFDKNKLWIVVVVMVLILANVGDALQNLMRLVAWGQTSMGQAALLVAIGLILLGLLVDRLAHR